MNNFLESYFDYINKFIISNYPNIKINYINIDKEIMFIYDEDESPLHNSVIYLNQKLLNSLSKNLKLLEIGCGVKSIFLESKNNQFSRIDGLDIHETDFRERETLANLIGSVANIPTRSNFYDYCISNQSIEHWFEYNVSLSLGLSEISRVLKNKSGKMIINFPLFLHGKSEFAKGNIEYILKEISNYFLIKEITFVYSESKKYKGWKICGQDIFRIRNHIKEKGIKSIPESIVCEIVAEKLFYNKKAKILKTSKIRRFINLYKDYTFLELIIKIINKVLSLRK
tara:strand:- start:212 stop:1063 length:852 start_codon:yes stop_codon:yes gene_type:complete